MSETDDTQGGAETPKYAPTEAPRPKDEPVKAGGAKKTRRRFDPGYGGGVGFLWVVLAAAGMLGLGSAVRVEGPEAKAAAPEVKADADAGPSKEDAEAARAREDEALLRPPAKEEPRKPGTFFGIPTE